MQIINSYLFSLIQFSHIFFIYTWRRLYEKIFYNLRIWLNANHIPRVFGSQVRISSSLYQWRRNRKKEKEEEEREREKEKKKEIEEGEEKGRDGQAASGLERFRLSGIAAGAGFFYSKCEFLARGIFSPSPPHPCLFYSHSSRCTCAHAHRQTDESARVHVYVRLSATTEPETACRMRRS